MNHYKKKKVITTISAIAASAGTIAAGIAFTDKILGGKLGQTIASKLPKTNDYLKSEKIGRIATAARRTLSGEWTVNAGPIDYVKDFIYQYKMGPTYDAMGVKF